MICNSLDQVRENIDRIDDNIIKLIAERGGYVAQASKFKKNEEGVKDKSRVEKVIQKVREKAQLYGANPDMVEALYREMISRFVKMEMNEFHKANPTDDKQILLSSIDRIHTTPMGADRILKNLKLTDTDPVAFCKAQIISPDCRIYKDGKNYYCEINGIKITVNSFSYTIITAHKM